MKYMDGSPSNTKLNSLPKAKLPMKTILINVANVQNLGLNIPIIQIADIPRYNPIIALKIFVKLIVSTLMSNNFDKIKFGFNPYTKAIGIIKAVDIIKCRFLIVNGLVVFHILKALVSLYSIIWPIISIKLRFLVEFNRKIGI